MDPVADIEQTFAPIPLLIAAHAARRPDHPALEQDGRVLSYGGLDAAMDQVAAALQRDGAVPGAVVAIVAASSIDYVVVFLGALRAGMVAAPLAPSATAEQLAAMVQDSGAGHLFLDEAAAAALTGQGERLPARRVALDGGDHGEPLATWLAPAGTVPAPVELTPEMPFNIIYSSGTTGTPKGIVQSHGMRWSHVRRGTLFAYGPQAVTLLSTGLYSNTTLVSLLPTLALGGTAVLMAKFDVAAWLTLAARRRVTHTMLVPVQYQRLMAFPGFDDFDLSAFQMKLSTSAPFNPALKADVLKRWPGRLVEVYGLTEGGGTCILPASEFPNKLHTVGRPASGHDIRIIDSDGRELPPGEVGEVVGRSPGMMTGYHRRPEATAEMEWFDEAGNRFLRTGDLGRFDEDGFLVLLDRRKDMIISGGFNIYPSDLEAVLRRHPAVAEAAVVGVPSERWGETPVGFVVCRRPAEAAEILAWANGQLGRTQRLAAVELREALPRSAIGKVLKRELRDGYRLAAEGAAVPARPAQA